jgi:hypothetical protein
MPQKLKKIIPITPTATVSDLNSLKGIVRQCQDAVLRRLTFNTILFRRSLDSRLKTGDGTPDALRTKYYSLETSEIKSANETMCFGLSRELINELKSHHVSAYLGIKNHIQNLIPKPYHAVTVIPFRFDDKCGVIWVDMGVQYAAPYCVPDSETFHYSSDLHYEYFADTTLSKRSIHITGYPKRSLPRRDIVINWGDKENFEAAERRASEQMYFKDRLSGVVGFDSNHRRYKVVIDPDASHIKFKTPDLQCEIEATDFKTSSERAKIDDIFDKNGDFRDFFCRPLHYSSDELISSINALFD